MIDYDKYKGAINGQLEIMETVSSNGDYKTWLRYDGKYVADIRFLSLSTAHLFADAPALLNRCLELEALNEWRPESTAPKGVPVLIKGGMAMKKTGGKWFTGMEEPLYTRQIEWEVLGWKPLPHMTDEEAQALNKAKGGE